MKRLFAKFGKRTWIIIGAIIAVLVVLFLVFRGNGNDAASAFQTETIGRGTLTATVGATGTVRAGNSAVLNWQTSGTLEAVNVKVGDRVSQGQVLASLEKSSLPQSIILAEADLVEAQKALEDLVGSDTARAQALIALKDAQDAYEKAYNYRQELNGIGWRQKVITRNVRGQIIPEVKWYRGPADPGTIASADDDLALKKAQLEDAQRSYDRLENGPYQGDVAAAEARVAAAQATLNMAYIIAPFAGTVTQAEASIGDQVAQGATDGQTTPGTTVGGQVTPTPGTEAGGQATPGAEAGGQATPAPGADAGNQAALRAIVGGQVVQGAFAFRVDDLSRLLVDVQISEVDINSVNLDQQVTLSFDAILDQDYHGKVVEVSQAGDITEGVVNFTVSVELTDADELVKPGMTAAVNIITTQLDGVLLVPNRAVRSMDGDRVVYVLRDNLPVPVKVELGQSSETQSVVVGGDLKEGDLVILNPPALNFGPFGG